MAPAWCLAWGGREVKGGVVVGKEEDTEFLSHMLRDTMEEQ